MPPRLRGSLPIRHYAITAGLQERIARRVALSRCYVVTLSLFPIRHSKLATSYLKRADPHHLRTDN